MALDQEALKQELIEAFHLGGIPKEKREDMLSKMGEALLKRIFLETMEKIGADGMGEYEALLDHGAKPAEVEAFLEKRIPGYNVFVRNIVTQFKEEMNAGLAT